MGDNWVCVLDWKVNLTTTAEALIELQHRLDLCMAEVCGAEDRHIIVAAVMEIAENIVHHAYLNPSPQNWLRVEIVLRTGQAEIVLSDGGRAFVPPPVDAHDLAALWTSTGRGGWGLSLARRAVDELTYAREGGVNRWKCVSRVTCCVG